MSDLDVEMMSNRGEDGPKWAVVVSKFDVNEGQFVYQTLDARWNRCPNSLVSPDNRSILINSPTENDVPAVYIMLNDVSSIEILPGNQLK